MTIDKIRFIQHGISLIPRQLPAAAHMCKIQKRAVVLMSVVVGGITGLPFRVFERPRIQLADIVEIRHPLKHGRVSVILGVSPRPFKMTVKCTGVMGIHLIEVHSILKGEGVWRRIRNDRYLVPSLGVTGALKPAKHILHAPIGHPCHPFAAAVSLQTDCAGGDKQHTLFPAGDTLYGF